MTTPAATAPGEEPPAAPGASRHRWADVVFFDGDCGLCHKSVLFFLDHEPVGEPVLRFAPLGGETFEEKLSPDQRHGLPDSLVVLAPDGEIYVRGRALRRLLDHLGGFWRALGILLRLVPLPVLDLVYRAVAAIRGRLFQRPKGSCPLVPLELRRRFLP